MDDHLDFEDDGATVEPVLPSDTADLPTAAEASPDGSTQGPSTLANALETARDRLLERSLRNKLINVNLTNNRSVVRLTASGQISSYRGRVTP